VSKSLNIYVQRKLASIKEVTKMGKKSSVKSPMTKDLLMKYTFIALCILAALSFISFGLDSIIISVISVLVAVVCDYLLSLIMGEKGPLNTMSAAVFGLIVAMSYSLGTAPAMATEQFSILGGAGIDKYLYPALISAVGLIVFKKIQGLAGRKYMNPAAIAKLLIIGLLVMAPSSALLPADHMGVFDLQNNLTEGMFGAYRPMETIVFGATMVSCYGNPNADPMNPYTYGTADNPLPDVIYVMLVQKYHGWIGGVSSIAVLAVGIALFALLRGYIKWRITLAYLVTTLLFSIVTGYIYGGDMAFRILFHLFTGSSIFLAFFMATDPATTPLTRLGQIIFGVGLALLTMILQIYMSFMGGSILALVVMNLTSPLLDSIGIPKSGEKKTERRRAEAKDFVAAKTYDCIRCGACMSVCHNSLSPILMKEAYTKQKVKNLMRLDSDYCTGCRTCNFVCPAGIDLERYTLGYPLLEEEAKEIEQQFLKGTADEDIGVYSEMFSAKSSIDGQDGGVATALLVSGLQNGLFDSAVVVKRTVGYWAEAVIAENVDEIMAAKGTMYLRVPLMSKLKDLIAKGKRKIAIVGMACEVRAARRIQQVLLREYPDLELTIIGLFCYECFDYYKLKEDVMRLLDVDLDRAEKTQIHKGKFIVQVDGKEHAMKVKELNNAVEERCLDCPDFSAQYSDISVGSVGSDEGYSTVIVRSNVGKKLLEKLDLAKGEVTKEEVTKLSVRKKKRANLSRSEK
jgi:coenzyme F420-reducing hydrogenase beta subunit/Na+-translocating ferredoxin:NAD+ oxidoreductase RnfD subunit